MELEFVRNTLFIVTGGAGFIGSNLCDEIISRGGRVRCLDNFSTGKMENIRHLLDRPGFELVEGDICDLKCCMKACEGGDYVLHQAAWGSVPRSIELPLAYEETNIRGTLNMMEAARQSRIKRFVYASSSSVYGDAEGLPKKEGAEGSVLSPYALTKRTNEEYGRLYFELYGLETVGLRYFNVFGKNQDPDGAYAAVIPKFIKLLLQNKAPVINGDGGQSRDFTYISNVVGANLKACTAPREAAGQAYNIACGGRETLLDVYEAIRGLLDKDIRPEFGPERRGDIRHSNADVGKAKRLLGYEPLVGFQEGLALAIQWYKDNLMDNDNKRG